MHIPYTFIVLYNLFFQIHGLTTIFMCFISRVHCLQCDRPWWVLLCRILQWQLSCGSPTPPLFWLSWCNSSKKGILLCACLTFLFYCLLLSPIINSLQFSWLIIMLLICLQWLPPQNGESWKVNNCVVATCKDGKVTLNETQCPPPEPLVCANNFPTIEVRDSDECCSHPECQCKSFQMTLLLGHNIF